MLIALDAVDLLSAQGNRPSLLAKVHTQLFLMLKYSQLFSSP